MYLFKVIFCFHTLKGAGKAEFFRDKCMTLRILRYSLFWEGQRRYLADVSCAGGFTYCKNLCHAEVLLLKEDSGKNIIPTQQAFLMISTWDTGSDSCMRLGLAQEETRLSALAIGEDFFYSLLLSRSSSKQLEKNYIVIVKWKVKRLELNYW